MPGPARRRKRDHECRTTSPERQSASDGGERGLGCEAVEQRHFPLGGTERRLQERVQQLLGEGERVRAAVVAFSGPRAGIEALLAPLLGLLSMFVNVARTMTTVAVTDRGVVLFDTRGLRRPIRVRE